MLRSLVLYFIFCLSFLNLSLFANQESCKSFNLVLEPYLFFLSSSSLYEEGRESPTYTIDYSFFEWTISHTHKVKDNKKKTLYKSYNSVFNLYDTLTISSIYKENEKDLYYFKKNHLISTSKKLSDEYLVERNSDTNSIGKLFINLETLKSFKFYGLKNTQMTASGVLSGDSYKIKICHFSDYPELPILLSMFLTTKASMFKLLKEL